MSSDNQRRVSTPQSGAVIPRAPPLPAHRPLQRAKDAAYRIIGYPPRSPNGLGSEDERSTFTPGYVPRHASLSSQNATVSHRTGLGINTIAINERGTHALLGGKEIFKTVKIEDGVCVEDINLRTAIRSNPRTASGQTRQIYSIDIADVAWAKGDCGDFVAAATSSGKIILYDLGHAGVPAAQLHEHYRQVHKVTFNPHRGNLLLSGSQDGTVRLWDLRDVSHEAQSLHSKRKYSGQNDGVRDVKWSPTDGVDFAVGTDSGWIQRWDIRNLKQAKIKIPAHSLACNTVDWHPDGKHIASAGSDKSVRVWDFSLSRKQKAAWEFKTPYPVMNARWRPSCEPSVSLDGSARQCTQIVTAYDTEHPIIHIWDFRRPSLPFRELMPYVTAPSDLLWHSQDLLWTVGREGIFLQSDIQHAPKVIDSRNLQSLAISALGDANFVVQKRKKSHTHAGAGAGDPKPTLMHKGSGLSTKSDSAFLSRSWADDGLDPSFLSLLPVKHHGRSGSAVRYTTAVPAGLVTRSLDEILHNRQSSRPEQSAIRGALPYHTLPEVYRYLASNYVSRVNFATTIDASVMQYLESAIECNASAADHCGLYRLAQSWRLLGMYAVRRLKVRSRISGGLVALDKIAVPKEQQSSDHATENVLKTEGQVSDWVRGVRAAEYVQARSGRGDIESPSLLPSETATAYEEEKFATILEMLLQLVNHHTGLGDAQTAAMLLTLISPLLPETHPLLPDEHNQVTAYYTQTYDALAEYLTEEADAVEQYIRPMLNAGLSPLQIEATLSTYHDQLLSYRLFTQAAALRKLSFPAYPAVYEDVLLDHEVHFGCGLCGKLMVSGTSSHHCDSCGLQQAKCLFCRCTDSPYGGGRLYTSCLLCNHGGHSACMEEYFGEIDGEQCMAEGCICKCAVH